tara:strand:- start:261 stop:998 length:738 start_codon:yes stop_codon:yes gene_type:complete
MQLGIVDLEKELGPREADHMGNDIKKVIDPEIYYNMLKWFDRNYPLEMHRFIESISPNQIEGKNWLVEELDKVQIPRDEEGRFKIEIVGGWFGFPLIDLLYNKYGDEIRAIDFFDMDPFASKVFGVYLSTWWVDIQDVKIFTNEMGDYFNYKEKRRAHLIINTSCEHMPDMKDMREYYFDPERTLLVLQSNNKTDEDDHINCVDSEIELAEKNGIGFLNGGFRTMKSREGKELNFWNRYMAMGKW